MLEAAFWGLVGGLALLVGAVLALARRVSPRVIGTVMAFGACVLISAVAFELVEEAFESAGAVPVMLGMVVGSLVFYAGDWVLDHRGGRNRKRSGRRRVQAWLIRNAHTKPAEVTSPTAPPALSKLSGIIVSASIVGIAPAAKDCTAAIVAGGVRECWTGRPQRRRPPPTLPP